MIHSNINLWHLWFEPFYILPRLPGMPTPLCSLLLACWTSLRWHISERFPFSLQVCETCSKTSYNSLILVPVADITVSSLILISLRSLWEEGLSLLCLCQFPKHLAQFLSHRKCSVNTCGLLGARQCLVIITFLTLQKATREKYAHSTLHRFPNEC